MLRGLFPRLFGQFKEGGIVHAKFVCSAGPVFALKSAVGTSNYQGLSLVKDTSTGFLALTLAGGARNIALVGAPVYVNIANPTTVAKFRTIHPYVAFNEGTGVLKFKVVDNTATPALTDPDATDELHFTLYVDK